ncbi:hypothetical protein AAFF_G00269990 [Aldrovandia affinis]|uniref:Uncharacterized protein n=1 Tax=Aldrovandia affinis TaxID=143900 RepID=A0AAD7WT21_9TELE|nr:hypothetical protein AAFF_G00269990 [Aldrovandia affinis]
MSWCLHPQPRYGDTVAFSWDKWEGRPGWNTPAPGDRGNRRVRGGRAGGMRLFRGLLAKVRKRMRTKGGQSIFTMFAPITTAGAWQGRFPLIPRTSCRDQPDGQEAANDHVTAGAAVSRACEPSEDRGGSGARARGEGGRGHTDA